MPKTPDEIKKGLEWDEVDESLRKIRFNDVGEVVEWKPKTSDDTKTGLQCCTVDGGCHDCPYQQDCFQTDGFSELAGDAFALIQQLEADNAQKDRCIENLTDKLNMMGDEVMALSEERGEIIRYLRSMGCDTCLYDDYDGSEPPCINCTAERDLWQWEGVQKEDD